MSADTEPPEKRPLRAYPLFWSLAFLVLLADQVTKYWIQHHSGYGYGLYPPQGGVEIIPGFLSFVHTSNHGAAWGLFQGFGFWLGLLGLATLVAILYWRDHLELYRRWHQIAFGLIAGGIAGNVIDRLFIGKVIDFIDVHLGFYRWPTFNLADSGIVVGVGLYLWCSWKPRR
jgi:signal peptidase II